MEDLYEAESVRRFVGLKVGCLADETTILLPTSIGTQLGKSLFEEINTWNSGD